MLRRGDVEMASSVTFQVLDGVDRGRVYRELPTPVMIGREEGNTVQLNDERVSRFHAKIQEDSDQFIITDLESTNGTRVNGEHVTFAILRVGDRVTIGRSTLLFGSPEDIAQLYSQPNDTERTGRVDDKTMLVGKTRQVDGIPQPKESSSDLHFDVNQPSPLVPANPRARPAPGLPTKLTPAQAAQLGELLMHLHRPLASATENGRRGPSDDSVHLNAQTWQQILAVTMQIARYYRSLGRPDDS